MKVVVQRVKKADCTVDGKITGKINNGLMVLVGFTYGDTEDTIVKMVQKIVNLRIFDDENGIMNLSVLDTNGEILSISQFTLYADTKKGNRPSYINAMKGEEATKLYDLFNEELRKYIHVETGIFGAMMDISLVNSGPTTIIMER
jgi:D-tyrosyl-tRNA(Tyr) deacylase